MKKSNKVALLITGSVILASCRHAKPPAPSGASGDWMASGTAAPSPTSSASSGYRGSSGGWHFWGGSSSTNPGNSSSSPSHGGGISRGGFGFHGSSGAS